MDRPPVAASLFLALLFGCGLADPVDDGAGSVVSSNNLTEELALSVIETSAAFRLEESTLHLLEWQLRTEAASQVWRIRRTTASPGPDWTVEILPEGRSYFRSADYLPGGVVPIRLVRPLGRRVVAVRSIANGPEPRTKDVRFAWEWADVPDLLERIKPELGDGPRPGIARLGFDGTTWRVVGRVTDFHASL